jgi:hypothetical protein
MIPGCWRTMTFSAFRLRRLPAFWPSVGSATARVQAERAFIVFPEGFVAPDHMEISAGNIGWKYQRNERERICRDDPFPNVLGAVGPDASGESSMIYAILAYHVETDVMSWTPEQDAGVMDRLLKTHDRLNHTTPLGPTARLGFTGKARTLRGPGQGTVMDGPFAETKEQLLGFYLLDCADDDAAVEVARSLRRANPGAVYEIRPVLKYLPGADIPAN